MSASQLLDGAQVHALHRHGKQLAIQADNGRVLVVQLGMSGQLLMDSSARALQSHRHLEWEVTPNSRSKFRLVFRDPRRFGGVHAAHSLSELRVGAWGDLGVDALQISAAQLRRSMNSTRPVKSVLLDQRAIAGVGNIYADESLFRARIAPGRRASSIVGADCSRLATAIRFILRTAVSRGGSTLRDHLSADGAPGTAQRWHRVYGRAGLPCMRCGSALRSTRLAGRTTVWCANCQS